MYPEAPPNPDEIAGLIAGLGVLFAVYGALLGGIFLATLIIPAVTCWLIAKAKGYDAVVAALCGMFLYPFALFYYIGLPLRRDDLRFPENRR